MTEFYITPESIAEHIGNLFVLGSQLIITCIIKKQFSSADLVSNRGLSFDCRMLGENLGCVSKQKIFLQALSKHFSHTLRSSSLELDDAVFHAKSALMVLLVQHLSVCSFQLQILLHDTWNKQTFVPVSHIARQLLNISFCSNLRLYIKDGQITSVWKVISLTYLHSFSWPAESSFYDRKKKFDCEVFNNTSPQHYWSMTLAKASLVSFWSHFPSFTL